jgi:hypothetical protein
MSGEERAVIQKFLWMGGFYGPEAIMQGVLPPLGYWDSSQQAVWDEFITSSMLTTTVGEKDGVAVKGMVQLAALDQQLRDRVTANQGLLGQAAASLTIPGKQFVLTDSADLENTVQSFASKYLGRELSAEEVGTAVGEMRSAQTAAFERQYQAYVNQAVGEFQKARTLGGRDSLDWAEPTLLMGGSETDSVAVRYGAQLAARWGGIVKATGGAAPGENPATAQLRAGGMGVTMRFADPESAARFAEWAEGQRQAEVPLDSQPVGNQPAHLGGGIVSAVIFDEVKGEVTVQFREGALAPALDNFAPNGTPVSETGAFLKALQDPSLGRERYLQNTTHTDRGYGQHGDYTYRKGPPQHIGAYNIRYQDYARIAPTLGIPPQNMSPLAQDRVARKLAEDLYAKYGDWEVVAVAWKWGETAVVSDSEGWYRNSVKEVMDRMIVDRNTPTANWQLSDYEKIWNQTTGAGGELQAGGMSMVEGYSESGEALRTLQKHQAVEKQAWGAMEGFGTMARIMGKLGGGYSSGG